MPNFSIEGFAEDCKQAMNNADDRRQAAKAFLKHTMAENNADHIISVLNTAIPEGADIGEMIVHTSPELTMLYGRVPPRFQSGIHNHTIFACIGQLAGTEVNVAYEKIPDGDGLRVMQTLRNDSGGVISMPENAIHHIENPNDETASALHIYGGDFGAVMGRRSLWSFDGHEEKAFSFPELLVESVKRMKLNNNEKGLAALINAIPAAKSMVDAL